MVRFGQKEIAKEKLYATKTYKNLDFTVDNIVTSILIETKTNSKFLIGIKFDKAIRLLVLIKPKRNGYVKPFKVKEGDNKFMSFCIDNEELFEKYNAIWTKTKVLNSLSVYDNTYIKTKIRKCGEKAHTNFHGLNVPEDDIECESFTVISIESLHV